ncbi:ABC transporter ATP-binding protein [Pelagibius litoralis]|uniref:ABC transporter ATP-binding protein n=1 Tax=Pelagibius litoralis TaxID=374515 RepID=A0A967F098_9PROT|nr:ABC transporter ATP-binding protein [Pelagibius litoralis]NIA70687.1 ABC transporter ATP-binding protein [Pelagibius litoralis]
MARVSLRDVNKIYRSRHDDVHAVNDLNLTVNDGEFVALLGPSGCGKTSTLRMIVGLEEISAGEIHFDDVLVNKLDSQARNVAMAFETYALYPNFTIEENLAFPLEVRGLPAPERRKKAREIAEILRIDDILDQRPGALSGGQQQRVSLGRALIRDPAVFILDEVMSHIDAHLKFQMLFDLKAIHQEMKRTMIYVTHDQVEALALADRVAVMSNAELQQFGTRNDLYHTPANVFVADFIGEPPTNFFEAELFTDHNGTVLKVVGSDLVIQLEPGHAQRILRWNERHLTVGIRPQSLHLGGDPALPALEAKVAINEYLGERSILTLTDGTRSFRAMVDPDTTAQRGERVKVHYALQDVMVFSGKTELIIL